MENNTIQTNPQAQTMKKLGFFMNIAMGITVSIILSTHGVLASGHFSVPSLAISMVVSCILALCIGFFLPVKPAKDKVTANMKMPVKFLVANIITNIFYVLIITSVNTSLLITLAKHAMDLNNVPPSVPRPSILAALPKSLISSYIISYIVTLILEPIFLKIAFKKYGINPKAQGMKPEGKTED
ncbi:hypothetical protein [Treponema sp.]|uniref:hypothetical protein n=1 Tax=Treponema sp. TaxID=166 RepID=UPI00298E7966|nr:hypothetical protein [Treponema sp.]MCQ2241844.1 hypothetical protein [Treponema sp.]